MSLSEAQEIFGLLTEIDKVLGDIELKIQNIQNDAPRIESALTSFRQVERLALRWLALSQRMGMPPDMQQVINIVTRLIVMLRMLQMSWNMMLMTNPITALIGIAGMTGVIFSGYDMLRGS